MGPEPVWMILRNEKSLLPTGIRNPVRCVGDNKQVSIIGKFQLWAHWSAQAVGEMKEMLLSKVIASADKETRVVRASTLYVHYMFIHYTQTSVRTS